MVSASRQMKVESYFYLKSKQILYNTLVFNYRKKRWEKFLTFSLGNGFLGMTLNLQTIKAKIDNWDHIKFKSLFTSYEISNSEETSNRKGVDVLCLLKSTMS